VTVSFICSTLSYIIVCIGSSSSSHNNFYNSNVTWYDGDITYARHYNRPMSRPTRQQQGSWQNPTTPADINPDSAQIDGDIILGGLFPIHERGTNNAPCGKIQADRGIQRMEAMLFAIDSINRDGHLLPGLRLGADVRDTCSRETYALEQALEYVKASMSGFEAERFTCSDGRPAQAIRTRTGAKEVAAVVGASISSVSEYLFFGCLAACTN
jgi:hypothetical protein